MPLDSFEEGKYVGSMGHKSNSKPILGNMDRSSSSLKDMVLQDIPGSLPCNRQEVHLPLS